MKGVTICALFGQGRAAEIIVGFEPVSAGQLDMPMGPQSAIQHIRFATPTLPPMAYTMFCCAIRTNVAHTRCFAGERFA